MSRKSKRLRHLRRYIKHQPRLIATRGQTVDVPYIALAITTVAGDMFDCAPDDVKKDVLADAFWVAMQGLVGPERARQIAGA